MPTINFISARTPLSGLPIEFARSGANVLVVLADDLTPIGAITRSQFEDLDERLGPAELDDFNVGELVTNDYFLASAASTSRSTAEESPVV